MKIDNAYKPTTAPISVRTPPQQAASADAQEAVSLSSLAGSLQNDDTPPVNAARIQEIKLAISEGRFQINSEAIADRLIETARTLVNKRQA